MASVLAPASAHAFLADGGEAGALVRAHDWAATPLGPFETWPQNLRTTVNIMLASPSPVAIMWGPERVQLYNDAYIPIAGERHPAALGRPAFENWAEAYEAFLGPTFDRVFMGETVEIEQHAVGLCNARGELEKRFFTGSFQPVRGEDGRVEGIFHPLVEVTAKVNADVAVREREVRLRGVLAGMAEGFSLLGPDFTILEHNVEAVVGRSHWAAYPGSEESEPGRLYKRAMAERVPVSLEHRYAFEDGRALWLEMRAYPTDEGALAVFWRDVTDRKEAEERLRASEARQSFLLGLGDRLRRLSDPVEVTLAAAELLGRHLGVARAGYGEIDAAGEVIHVERDWAEGVPSLAGEARLLDGFGQAIAAELREGRTLRVDDSATDPRATGDGVAEAWASIDLRAIIAVPLIKGGRFAAFFYLHEPEPRTWTDDEVALAEEVAERTWDALERARAETTLRVERELLNTVIAQAPVGISIAEAPSGRALTINAKAEELLGHRQTGEGADRYEGYGAIHTDGRAYAVDDYPTMRAVRHGEVVELEEMLYRRGGPGGAETTRLAVSSAPVRDSAGKVVAAATVFIDVEEQRRSEEALRLSEERYRQLVEGAEGFAIVKLDESGTIKSWNSGAERITGFSETDAVGQPSALFFTPEDRAAGTHAEELRRATRDGRTPNERWHLKKDGTRFWSSGLTSRLDSPAGFLKIFADRTAEHEAEAGLRRRSEQLQGLAEVATAVARAPTLEATLGEVTRAARRIVGAHQSVVSLTQGDDWAQVIPCLEPSEKYADWRNYTTPADDSGIYALVCQTNQPLRLTQAELEAHPQWRGVGAHAADHPPMRGWLGAPLVGRDGRSLGLIQLSDKEDGSEFDENDEAVIVQLAGFASAAIEQSAAEKALRESAAALATEVGALGRLQEVSTRLVGDEAPQALYDAILAAAADLMGSECASLQMLDAGGDLQLLAHLGYDPRSAEYWQTVDASSESTCGIALTTGERVVVPDVEDSGLAADSGDLQSYRWTGMRAVQTTPLLSRSGKPLGMLSTHWKHPHTPSERDLKLFDVLARQAADAIERTTAQAELRESEARQAFLLSLSDALRSLRTPADIASAAAERLGERFGLNRVFYAEYLGSLMKVERDYTDGVDSIVGEHDLQAFGPELLRAYHDCPIVKVDDVRTDPRFSEEAREGLLARQVGAYLDVILFEDEQWVSLLALQSATPRSWTASEEGLFREVAERVKVAIERARAEDQLRELNETLEAQVAERTAELRRYHDIVDATVAPICAFDTDYRLIAFNRAHNDEFRRVNGFDTKIGDVFPDLFIPEQGAKMRELMTRALTGESFTVNEEFGRPELDTPCWEITYTPLLDEAGRVVGAFHHAVDISERLVAQAELEAAQEALRQSQKMEAMGQLTGGVAHDFNNLLTPIVGTLDMLQRKGLGGEREQRLIAGAAQSAERAKTLVQRLLAFARRQPLQAVPVDIAKLVHGMGDLVSSTIGPQIRVLVEAPDDLPPAKADPNQLEMALLNLSVNARDAMPDNGTLRISVSAEAVGAGHRSKLRPGTYIRLSVADTGSGMDEATIARAVEPFFSTKGVGKGTGLGLSMVHGLASQLGGALTIQSRLGLGANVELWLPLSEDAPEALETASAPAPRPSARGTALLVDDEELVRMSTADMLSDLGYAVISTASAEEAVRIVDEGERVDLLVTDHLMPGMNGTDLARAIRAARPGVPVLLVSGYAERKGIEPDLPRLAKPFRKDELAASLAQLQSSR